MPKGRFPWPMGSRSGGPLLGRGGLPGGFFDYYPETGAPVPVSSTFSRTSARLQFNGTAYESVAADTPRDNHHAFFGGSRGTLIEPEITNDVLVSTDFEDASWANSGLTLTDNGLASVGLNQYEFDAGVGSGTHRVFAVGLSVLDCVGYGIASAGTGRYFIVRNGVGGTHYACFDLLTGVVAEIGSGLASAYMVHLGFGIYICVTRTATASNGTFHLGISDIATPGTGDISFTGANETIFVYHAQRQPNSLFAGVPIITTGIAVTHDADNFTDISWPIESSAVVDVTLPPEIVGGGANDDQVNMLGFGTATDANFVVNTSNNVSIINSGITATVVAVSSYEDERHAFGMSLKENEGIVVDDEDNDDEDLTGTIVNGTIQIGLNSASEGLPATYHRIQISNQTLTADGLKGFL